MDTAIVQTPDRRRRLKLIKFHMPAAHGGNRHTPANTPGIGHVAFAVEDVDAVVAGLGVHGAELVGEPECYGGRPHRPRQLVALPRGLLELTTIPVWIRRRGSG